MFIIVRIDLSDYFQGQQIVYPISTAVDPHERIYKSDEISVVAAWRTFLHAFVSVSLLLYWVSIVIDLSRSNVHKSTFP